jgi:hypothetical protein
MVAERERSDAIEERIEELPFDTEFKSALWLLAQAEGEMGRRASLEGFGRSAQLDRFSPLQQRESWCRAQARRGVATRRRLSAVRQDTVPAAQRALATHSLREDLRGA